MEGFPVPQTFSSNLPFKDFVLKNRAYVAYAVFWLFRLVFGIIFLEKPRSKRILVGMKIYFMSKNLEKRKMNKDRIEKHVRNQISKFDIPFDIQEAQKSNILICGTNHTGKSRLACNITSILQNLNWKIVSFDNTGIWRRISYISTWYQVTEQNIDLEYKTVNYPFFRHSIICDTSLL